MVIGAAEALLLAGAVLFCYVALTPLRRRLEARIARWLRPRKRSGGGRVVVLERRSDGSFGKGDRHG